MKARRINILLGILSIAACVSPQSPITQAAGTCPEFTVDQAIPDSVTVDQTVKIFMQASSTFDQVTADMKGIVKTACININGDLGVSDTWSKLGDDDGAISNTDGTGACDQAATKIKAIMTDSGAISANFALITQQGECHLDFDAQAKCDAGCDTTNACTPGSIQTRCEPGQLSVKCDQNCTQNSLCEGTASASANCSGSCAATCSGHCTGGCIHDDGTISMNDDNCNGKCTDHCEGTCSGMCLVTASAGISCGSDIRCKGSCTGSFTDPVCESEFNPPDCTQNQQCHASCTAKIAANPICAPSTVQLIANVSAVSNKDDVQKLVKTINANLPKLVDAARVKGQLAVSAVVKLSDTGQQVINQSGTLDGHSLACAKVAATADLKAANSLKLLNQGSLTVTNSCQSHAK